MAMDDHRRNIFILLILAAVTIVGNSTSTAELESTLSALRSHNYNLFADALITSDLLFELHSNLTTASSSSNASVSRTFTLFAPPDSALFALDMTASALVYVQTLRYHIVPRRIAASDLMQIRSGSCLPTLLSWREIRVNRRMWRSGVVVAVDDVNVVVPGLYYGDGVAVHGLSGVLNSRFAHIRGRHGWSALSEMNRTVSGAVSAENSTASFPENQTFIPEIPKQSVANGSVFSPIPRLPIFNDSSPPPPLNSQLPSSNISNPPEMFNREGMNGSSQISPSEELHEALTREESTTWMMKRSAKLLEVVEMGSTEMDGDDEAVVDETQMSDDVSIDTGYEL